MNRILSLLMLCNMFSLVSANSYEEQRAVFKEILTRKQNGLMPADEYNVFIEPYIQKAEQTLQIPQHFKQSPDSVLMQKYFDVLTHYNVVCFYACANTNSKRYSALMLGAKEELRQLYQKIQKTKIKSLDVQTELAQTTSLFEQANKDFIKKLGLVNRFKVFLFS